MRYRAPLLNSIAGAAALVLLVAWFGSAPPPVAASTAASPLGDGQPGTLSTARRDPSCLTGEGEAAQCCFTHPGYAGVCVVEPAKDETCATVLRYLNNPRSQGKTYCNNTTLRGGWKLVPCKEMPPTD
jgi:hypothetical protein